MLIPDAYRIPELPEPSRRLHIDDTQWLGALYPDLHSRPDWWLEFRFLEDRPTRDKRAPVVVRFLQRPEDIIELLDTHRQLAVQRAQQLQQGQLGGPWPAALFWGVQPRSAQQGRKEDVPALVVFACDLDLKVWREVPE